MAGELSSPTGTTVRLSACVAVALTWSVTSAVKLVVPTSVLAGVPVITPVDVFSDAQPGSDPEEIDQVYGVVPLTAVSVAE
jgi:hypothetical protein